MAAATLTAIMGGLRDRLATISGLRASDVSPGQINPPAAIVGVPSVPEYRSTMGRGVFTVEATVTVLVSAGAPTDQAQRDLATYADVTGVNSIPTAIEADRTLGGVVADCVVTAFRPLGLEEVGAIGYYGGVFTVLVVAPGV